MTPQQMIEKGDNYYYGWKGHQKDPSQAVIFYRMAAELGDADGMVRLARMYRRGLGGLKQDVTEAVALYARAANVGHWGGMYALGEMFELGEIGGKGDDKSAVDWYRKSAEAGAPSGMIKMGIMHLEGRGSLREDYLEGTKWLHRAAAQNAPRAMIVLGDLCRDGWRHLLARNDLAAASYYADAALRHELEGIERLAHMYEAGRWDFELERPDLRYIVGAVREAVLPSRARGHDARSPEEKRHEIIGLFHDGAGRGSPGATRVLASLYDRGHFVPQDRGRAARLLLQALKRGDDAVAKRLREKPQAYSGECRRHLKKQLADEVRHTPMAVQLMEDEAPDELGSQTWEALDAIFNAKPENPD